MVVLIQCTDKTGLIAGITGVMAKKGINIISMQQHVDILANRFFSRLVGEPYGDVSSLFGDLQVVLPADAVISINPGTEKKIIVLATKEYHCLSDILVRN